VRSVLQDIDIYYLTDAVPSGVYSTVATVDELQGTMEAATPNEKFISIELGVQFLVCSPALLSALWS
jgi:hypothetical protein